VVDGLYRLSVPNELPVALVVALVLTTTDRGLVFHHHRFEVFH